MFHELADQPQYESFTECADDLKARYRRLHRGETEGLDYQFVVTCNPDGRSGFAKVERLEDSPTAPNVRTETLLIDDNKIVGHAVEDPLPGGEHSCWL